MTEREPASEHLKNGVQLLMSLMDNAGNLDEPFLRDEVINHLADIRNRIEAALGIIEEVKEPFRVLPSPPELARLPRPFVQQLRDALYNLRTLL